MSGMEPQPMKGLKLADSDESSTEFTNSGSGPSNSKRKRSSSDSALLDVKRRRTTSREHSPKPIVPSPVKSIEGEIIPLTTIESVSEGGYIHANLKRKRSTSEPETYSLKRRKLASGNQPITWNSLSPVRDDSGGDAMNSKGYVKTSNQARSISKIDLPDSTSTDCSEKLDNCNANPLSVSDVDRCLLTQELSSEASVDPCYLLNQRLWSNSDLLTRLELSWGMEYNSLDPRSESNKIYLRRDWLKSFDSERWLLLPTPEMIEKVSAHCDNFMLDSSTHSNLPSIETIYDGAETFEYRMLLLDVELRSFNRINWPDSSSGTNFRNNRIAADRRSTRHYPPFHTLPSLISRAKPHFVICDTAAKMYQRVAYGPEFAAKLKSVWHGHDFDPFSMRVSIQDAYDTWFACDVPARYATIPRVLVPIPPLYPYPTVAERQRPSKVCTGPCVHSRSAWMPTRCPRCRGVSTQPTRDPNSAHSDSDGALHIGEPSVRMAEFQAHLRRVARRVNDWQSCCMQQVKSRGRWTSRVVNDQQLGGYSKKPRRTL